jgi:hypothetical protein
MDGFRDIGKPLFIPMRVQSGYRVTGGQAGFGSWGTGKKDLGFIIVLIPEGSGFPDIVHRMGDGFADIGGNP